MFSDSELSKASFLDKTKAAREERAFGKKKDESVIVIQATIRGWLERKRFERYILCEFDKVIVENNNTQIVLGTCSSVYKWASPFLKLFKGTPAYLERLQRLGRYMIASLESVNPKQTYIGIVFNKTQSIAWIRHIKLFLYRCLTCIEKLKPESHTDSITLALYLNVMVSFTSPNNWAILRTKEMVQMKPAMSKLCSNIVGDLVQKDFFNSLKILLLKGTCRTTVTIKVISFRAIMTLLLRPLIYAQMSQNILMVHIEYIQTIPALMYHLETMIPDFMGVIHSNMLVDKLLDILSSEEALQIIMSKLKGTQILALLGNLINLFHAEPEGSSTIMCYPKFTFVCSNLLRKIPTVIGSKSGTFTQWNDLLGWYCPSPEVLSNENLSFIRKQLYLLWSPKIINLLLGSKMRALSVGYDKREMCTSAKSSGNLFKRVLENKTRSNLVWRKIDSPDALQIANTCVLYYTAQTNLGQLKLDILSGLCYHDTLLHDFHIFIASLGPTFGLKSFTEIISDADSPSTIMLLLYCDLMTHYVTILDDIEMYEQQAPFELTDFVVLSNFINVLLYKTIHGHLIDTKTINTSPVFIALHTLLMSLYRRDNRRPFAPIGHWIIPTIRPSVFLSDLEKNRKSAQIILQKMPHIIPHDDRVKLFRKYVQNEKSILGLTDSVCISNSSTLITVHRDRIVEDGYRQLTMLSPHALKGVIRVRFINQQGLDEAGIDQDGVFKEFLEETIKSVFDPSLNLFKTTTDQRLYPSPTSHMQENHLQLFEFVGRMLGKAVYEGIVVDVPFAMFFLSQVLLQSHPALYSCMDELPSLDAELYRNLSFIKHYQQNVADLELTFSVDEDQMGKIVTHELISGGRLKTVTNENKINYIHYMAFFRMHTQIREQTSAFVRGFRSIINPDWLSLFSTPDVQNLIAGDTVEINLKSLRECTIYYGGFHDSHRVVGWLWDVLEEFNEEEKKLFLKFVTSCSKPPLLGFAHLEPPFSIRCVEVGDDEDTGDTIGSVIRGFFTIRKKDPLNRLPTSSTCFNLLKLPNYQRKSTLRDKLRYAISSNTGFELS